MRRGVEGARPGCRAPTAWTDLHHVVPRRRDGPTTVDNLVCLCRRHHRPSPTVTGAHEHRLSGSDPPLRG
ncbi:HNH endonuclease signature motif containing protein [Egicoccus halophilus]|uniref:HNH endonuclease signature motif containing protein n=1 Tax=Egicoccus halophilus TaxID=1670830 RepID=UPI00351A9AF4